MPTELEKIYWSLGNRWWKQIIDGDCHQFGPAVFDEGLHGGAKEPGFIWSLYAGMEYAAAQLGTPLTVDFYKKLHETLCSHFAGWQNNTLMQAKDAGQFRTASITSDYALKYCLADEMSLDYFFVELSERMKRAALFRSAYLKTNKECLAKSVFDAWSSFTQENYPQKYRFAKKFIELVKQSPDIETLFKTQPAISAKKIMQFETDWHKKVTALNIYTADIAKQLGCPLFVTFKLTTLAKSGESSVMSIKIDYLNMEPLALDKAINQLFANFNNAIPRACTRKQKLTLIADLYQKLEWLHPFPDGQGRVDLVLMSKLLTEHGFHPVILDRPYFSSTSTLDEWVNELEKGLTAWEKLNDEIHPQKNSSKKIAARL